MPTTTIFCPACNHKLRVPDELMAQPVQCPKCGSTFTAPPPASGAEDLLGPRDREISRAARPASVGQSYADEPEYLANDRQDWNEHQAQVARAKVTPPAICMLVVAILNVLLNVYGLISTLLNPNAIRDFTNQLGQAMGGAPPPPIDIAKLNMVVAGIFIVLSLVQVGGAIAMLRRSGYALAMMGAVLSLLNCNNVCCLLSIPVGIWSLVTLLHPDVKSSFS